MTTTEQPKTLLINGHKLSLLTGRRYRASRPMGKVKDITVRIVDITNGEGWVGNAADPDTIARVVGLTYDEANDLLAAFNNEPDNSFAGRVW